jgi:hypothetical protein
MERDVMSRRGLVLRSVAAGVLLLLAAFLAFAAHDVHGWSGQDERADAAVERFSKDLGVWQPDTWLPPVVSRSLLGTGDDVRFGQALQKLQLLRGRPRPTVENGSIGPVNVEPFNPPALDLAQLELTFDRISQSNSRANVRSQAAELHGVLYFQQVLLQGAASGDGGLTALERAITVLDEAVRIDPTNAEAQYVLEWLMNTYRPIAVERAGQLSVHQARRGDTAGGGGTPGLTFAAGGF